MVSDVVVAVKMEVVVCSCSDCKPQLVVEAVVVKMVVIIGSCSG